LLGSSTPARSGLGPLSSGSSITLGLWSPLLPFTLSATTSSQPREKLVIRPVGVSDGSGRVARFPAYGSLGGFKKGLSDSSTCHRTAENPGEKGAGAFLENRTVDAAGSRYVHRNRSGPPGKVHLGCSSSLDEQHLAHHLDSHRVWQCRKPLTSCSLPGGG